MTKRCSKCGRVNELNAENFYRNVKSPDGFRADCKLCHKDPVLPGRRTRQEAKREYMKQYGIINADLLRDSRFRHDYGLTLNQYIEIFEEQGCVCKICKKPSTMSLAVDHDHSCCPGKISCGKCIRGLLCGNCNIALGNFQDDIVILQSAIDYLQGSYIEVRDLEFRAFRKRRTRQEIDASLR